MQGVDHWGQRLLLSFVKTGMGVLSQDGRTSVGFDSFRGAEVSQQLLTAPQNLCVCVRLATSAWVTSEGRQLPSQPAVGASQEPLECERSEPVCGWCVRELCCLMGLSD